MSFTEYKKAHNKDRREILAGNLPLEIGIFGLAVAVLLILLGSAIAHGGEVVGGLVPPSYESRLAPLSDGAEEPAVRPFVRSAPAPYDQGDPTAIEQYLMEMLNRARLDPAAEAARFGIGLNDGISGTTISTEAKQPLVFNPHLLAAARSHSQWMLDTDVFSHTGINNSEPIDRANAAGYPYYASVGENIAWKGWTSPLDGELLITYVEAEHENLFKSPSHRLNMLRDFWVEGGMGCVGGPFTSNGNVYNVLMTTQDLGRSDFSPAVAPGSHFLTGVVYEDRDGNGFYSPGEGIQGVTVEPADNPFFAVSSASGGYAVPLQGTPETLHVFVYGDPWTGTVEYDIACGGSNVKLDPVYDPDAVLQTLDFIIGPLPAGVPEGKTTSFAVSLSEAPLGAVPVTVERVDGDEDLTVVDGASLEFTPDNYTGKTVTIAAAEDADTAHGPATFTIRLTYVRTGYLIEPQIFALQEIDDDIVVTLNASGNGTTIPAGATVVDTDGDLPLAVAAVPGDGGQFLAWHDPAGVLADATLAATTLSANADVTVTALFSSGDFDRDNLRDEWEYEHFGDLSHGPDEDSENDGHSNFVESLANFSPYLDESHLEVTVLHEGWNLFVPPPEMAGKTLREALGDDVDPQLWSWDAGSRIYVRGDDILSTRKAAWILARKTLAVVSASR